MTTQDPVGSALAGIGAGATTGAAFFTAGALLLRLLQGGRPPAVPQDVGFAIVSGSVALGIAVAAASGWLRARAIEDTWRRAVVSALSVFGAALLALLAAPADMFGGSVGLAAYLTLLVVAATYAHAVAIRAAR